jgi:hypothetical protein
MHGQNKSVWLALNCLSNLWDDGHIVAVVQIDGHFLTWMEDTMETVRQLKSSGQVYSIRANLSNDVQFYVAATVPEEVVSRTRLLNFTELTDKELELIRRDAKCIEVSCALVEVKEDKFRWEANVAGLDRGCLETVIVSGAILNQIKRYGELLFSKSPQVVG